MFGLNPAESDSQATFFALPEMKRAWRSFSHTLFCGRKRSERKNGMYKMYLQIQNSNLSFLIPCALFPTHRAHKEY